RVTVAELLHHGAGEGQTASETEELRKAALEELETYRREIAAKGGSPAPRALRLQADIYREIDELTKAGATYEELLRLYRGTEHARDVPRILQDIRFEDELRRLDATQGWRPTKEAEAAYKRGVAALRRGDFEEAEAELTWAIDDSPWFPRAYYT